jgi:hypothetical protein
MDGRGRRGHAGRGRGGLFPSDSDDEEARPSQSPAAAQVVAPPSAPTVPEPTLGELRQRYESDSDEELVEDVGNLSIASVVHSSASTVVGRGRGFGKISFWI